MSKSKSKDEFRRVVSYSQYTMYENCPRQYKLRYIDRLSIKEGSIHLIFGTALHEVIQTYLTTMYKSTKKKANALNVDKMLMEKMIEEFKISKERSEAKTNPCTQLEMEEFYGQGRQVIKWFKSHVRDFYMKRGFELVGIELEMDNQLKDKLWFTGFIDVCIKNKETGVYTIIDIKTSTKGWSKWQKNDKKKTAQILLYKKFFSEKYDVPLDKINVEYQIFKRMLPESDWPIPRISKFVPPHGKPSVNKVAKSFQNMIDDVFNDDGSFKEGEYPKRPGPKQSHCRFCEFMERGICDGIPEEKKVEEKEEKKNDFFH